MVFSKKDIEKARESYWLKKGKEKFGSKVKSIDNLEFKKQVKFVPLGTRLVKQLKRRR